MCGYGDNGAYAALHLNTTASAEAPAAPQNVKAEVIDGKLVITWDYDTDEAMANDVVYNVYVKNAEGKIYTVVPANPETGFVKVGYGRTVGIRPQIKEYSINAPAGDCTVGVQAISTANETYSEFVTATAESTGVAAIDSEADTTATYYNVQGQRVDNPAKGQLLIQVKGNKASKVIF